MVVSLPHPADRPEGAHTQGAMQMSLTLNGRTGRSLLLASLLMGSASFATSALAGSCPASAMKPNVREAVKFEPVGVTDTVLAQIDLAKEPIKADGRLQRVRKLVIQPGGIVPWHSHDDRPALIYIVEGEIIEYNSNCSAPILHKAGEVATETLGTAHWWKNLGDKTVTLLSFDILHDKMDKHM
jgi:quercetin dioxygenase-like cupin family protein